MSVAAKDSDSGDTAESVSVKNCGGNARLARRCAWFVAGFMEWTMESSRSRSFVLCDIVLYAGPFLGAVGGL